MSERMWAEMAEILDERTWPAMDVTAEADVALVTPMVRDVTNSIWYDKADFPVTLALYTEVQGQVAALNNSSYVITVVITVELLDKDGIAHGRYTGSPATIQPGWTYTLQTDYVILSKEGSWKIHAIVESGYGLTEAMWQL